MGKAKATKAVGAKTPTEEPGIKVSKFAVVRDGVKLRRALNEALDLLPPADRQVPGKTRVVLETLEDGQTRIEFESAYKA